ncbi:hypothetical protein [Streptomyces sp. sk2.1]|uniref:hypothetical protein n=1 Tax=Streptomyces sp. sk2.1 TaxID=2478959 RepID=UPI0021CD0576|nr:hypothetical protein [Streptomyces sp. sk2.1]
MRKIPTLFVRNPEDRQHVLPDVSPGCAWVLEGEGRATRKWDGTCVRLDEAGDWWARREVKPGKTLPVGYLPVEEDPVTGKRVGWEPVEQSSFAKYHAEALAICKVDAVGTYELLGPKINRNPDDFEQHVLMPHGWAPFSVRQDYATAPRDYDGLRDWLHARPHEGIVWWRDPADPHCDKVKLKAKDFPRKTNTTSAAAPEGPGKVIKTAGHDHDHWSWACPKEDGGCGYQSPWHMRTEAAAQQALEEHLEKCRAADEKPVNPATRASSATSD